MNRRIRYAAWCLLAGLSGGCRLPGPPAGPGATVAEPEPERLLVAHYFNWFHTPDGRGGWHMWEWKGTGPTHDPERLGPDGRRDIASVFHPRIGPYDSSRPEVMEYHLLLAKLSGLDGFVVDWYGLGHHDDRLMEPLLDQAAQLGLRVGICFEDKAMFGYAYQARSREEAVQNAISNLAYVLTRYAPHPAYLRLEGRPVVLNFSWSEPQADVSAQGFSAGEWRRIQAAVRDRQALYFLHDFHGHVQETYWDAADNVYPWLDVNGASLERFYREAQERIASGRIQSVAALVYPGFDNTGVWGWGSGPFVTPRGDGELYQRLWDDVLGHPLQLVQIATWNDFGEGATIEPADEYGFRYLELTQEYAARWKGRPPPDPSLLRLPEQLYRLRVELRGAPDAARTHLLDRAARELAEGRGAAARALLEPGPNP